jgi:uncharacterized protein YfaS (alpha-2-macroglobulin family)
MSQPNDHVRHLADDHVHRLLPAGTAERVEQHCRNCPACRAAVDEALQRLTALRSAPPVEASAQLIQATLDRVEAHQRKARRLRRWLLWGELTAVAASVLLLLGFQLHYNRLSASPYDLTVLGQNELLAATNASLRVLLLDRASGNPVAGVPVVVELVGGGRVAELARFTTDATGSGRPRFRLPDWSDGSYELKVTADTPGTAEHIARPVRLKRSWQLMLSSDKPVYQPGQKIQLRALALRRPDLRPVAEESATFLISDARGNAIFKEAGKTSAFGITAAECELASEVLEGPYSVQCKVGDTESRLSVEVMKYVLPKFKIDATFDRPYYQPGDSVRCTLQGGYFFGKPVAHGSIEVAVRTTDAQPRTLDTLKGQTDDDGKLTLTWMVRDGLVGREQDGGDARLSFHVTLTDSAGQKQTRTAERLVTMRPVRIEALPEAGTLVRGVTNTVYLLVTRADGTPVKNARVAVSGIDKELRTGEHGIASFTVTPETNEAAWTLRADDAEGKVLVRRHVELKCGQAVNDFLLRTDRATYRAGETMTLSALGGGKEPVFVDFLKDGQMLLTQTLDVADGKGETAFDLPADLFGTVEVLAYRCNTAGVAVRKRRVVYVHPAGEVRIRTTLDQGQYRPGEKARVTFTLTDAKGEPCPGALSLAAVDEAVFSVLQQAPGTERSFYLLERQLLQPVYAIYPWSPNLPGDAGGNDGFEQALFSATAQSEGSAAQGAQAGGIPQTRYSLSVNTYPDKEQHATVAKWTGQRWVRWGWIVLAFQMLVAGYIALWLGFTTDTVLKIHMVGAMLVIPLVLLLGGYLVVERKAMRFDAESVKMSLGGGRPARGEINAVGIDEVPCDGPAEEKPSVRVRQSFPETLLWLPQKVTDDKGRLTLDIDLADSITTWRLSSSAVTADGRLGAAQTPVKVFTPFFVDLNLPVSLTRGDEVGIPVVVYNYLDKPQTVTLTLTAAPWFTSGDGSEQRLELAAGEVRSTSYRLKVTKVGSHLLKVTARGDGVADALERRVEVVPDGRRVEQVVNGTLQTPADIPLTVPQEAIEGSVKAFLKVYPSSFSQLVEGLEGIFRMPSGCFEQTSSTTYPNVLALDYLKRTKKNSPEVEARARQYIHLGYQRLLSFEIPDGGFDWFGRPPANRTLTAYGLMEFEDMARVHDIDPRLIERTRNWLLKERKSDGSWQPEGHALHENVLGGEDPRLSTTAYIAWAVFASKDAAPQAQTTRDYLLSHRPETIADAHTLALVCNALLVLDPEKKSVRPYLDRLDAMKTVEQDRFAFWRQREGGRTTFHGTGRSGSIETTALAALAFIKGEAHVSTTRQALAWLAAQKDANGTWYSTQATVLSLKALLAGTGRPLGGDGTRRVEVRLSGNLIEKIEIPANKSEVMYQLDLSPHLAAGEQRLTLTETSETSAGYQVSFRYHVPGADRPEKAELLAVELAYDRTELAVDETVKATATVINRMPQPAAMVMLDLPVPPGFAPNSEDFAALVSKNVIAKFQVQPRSVLVYLRDLKPAQPLELKYTLRATMPLKVAAPGARVYEYYDPDKQGRSAGTQLTVKPGR